MSGAILEIEWADDTHRFRLAIGQLRELQEKCDAGPAEIFHRLTEQRWRVEDLRETIRLGLIGGGMTPAAALVKVRRYVEDRPLMESVPVARAVLLAALMGVPGDEVGKEGREETTPATGGSASPSSTEQEPHSGSPLSKLMQ